MPPLMFRQGDLLLVAVKPPSPQATGLPRPEDRLILARGEASGHAHAICEPGAEILRWGYPPVLRVNDPAGVTLSHEEHAPLRIPPGAYHVVIQRRFLPGGGSALGLD